MHQAFWGKGWLHVVDSSITKHYQASVLGGQTLSGITQDRASVLSVRHHQASAGISIRYGSIFLGQDLYGRFGIVLLYNLVLEIFACKMQRHKI